jgi:hypothetical protein
MEERKVSASVTDTGKSEIWIDTADILWIRPQKGTIMDLEEAKKCFQVYRDFGCYEKKKLQIVDGREDFIMHKEIRDFVALNGPDCFLASAVISDNLPIILLVNFFIFFSHQAIPLKLFREEGEALEWLDQFRL